MTNRLYKMLFLSLISAVILVACGKKEAESEAAKEGEDKKEQKEWKEMDDFHMLMAESYHPYKDSSNLEPAKANVNELVASADKWSNAALPEKVDDEEMSGMLQNLKSECESLKDVIQVGKDEEIAAQLTKVHDSFHKIQERWYGGPHAHSHEEHEHVH